MEFKFNVNEIFPQPIVEVNQTLIPPGFSGDRRALWEAVGKVTEVVNAMGEASAAAQGLAKPITTANRLRNSEHKIYFLIDQNAGNGKGALTGMLKVGQKGLYVFDRDGRHYQVSPPCVLDFYIHESRQRTGFGKRLYEHMLQKESVEPVKLAIDRPSEKFLGFLNKHYSLNTPIKQMNNYVVFDGFFPNGSEKNGVTDDIKNSSTPGKSKSGANGLQNFSSAYGRYAAPRPACSMGQIIHNQSSTVQRAQEPPGVRSAPVTNYQHQQPGSTAHISQNQIGNYAADTQQFLENNQNYAQMPQQQYYQSVPVMQNYNNMPQYEEEYSEEVPQQPQQQYPAMYQQQNYQAVPTHAQYQYTPTEQAYIMPQQQHLLQQPHSTPQFYQQPDGQIYAYHPEPVEQMVQPTAIQSMPLQVPVEQPVQVIPPHQTQAQLQLAQPQPMTPRSRFTQPTMGEILRHQTVASLPPQQEEIIPISLQQTESRIPPKSGMSQSQMVQRIQSSEKPKTPRVHQEVASPRKSQQEMQQQQQRMPQFISAQPQETQSRQYVASQEVPQYSAAQQQPNQVTAQQYETAQEVPQQHTRQRQQAHQLQAPYATTEDVPQQPARQRQQQYSVTQQQQAQVAPQQYAAAQEVSQQQARQRQQQYAAAQQQQAQVTPQQYAAAQEVPQQQARQRQQQYSAAQQQQAQVAAQQYAAAQEVPQPQARQRQQYSTPQQQAQVPQQYTVPQEVPKQHARQQYSPPQTAIPQQEPTGQRVAQIGLQQQQQQPDQQRVPQFVVPQQQAVVPMEKLSPRPADLEQQPPQSKFVGQAQPEAPQIMPQPQAVQQVNYLGQSHSQPGMGHPQMVMNQSHSQPTLNQQPEGYEYMVPPVEYNNAYAEGTPVRRRRHQKTDGVDRPDYAQKILIERNLKFEGLGNVSTPMVDGELPYGYPPQSKITSRIIMPVLKDIRARS